MKTTELDVFSINSMLKLFLLKVSFDNIRFLTIIPCHFQALSSRILLSNSCSKRGEGGGGSEGRREVVY